VTDVGVVALVSKKLPLKCMDLSFNYSITDDSLRAIGLHCPQLEYFIGTACSKITSSGVYSLIFCGDTKAQRKHPNLKYLILNQCSRVTNECITQVKRVFHDKITIHCRL
jgi:hypothetical protein